jgi:hypothetical protein
MANVIGLSQEHEDNLRKLADYLLAPNLKAAFDMRNFTDNKSCKPASDEIECGSVGCAVGHGPYAGIPKLLGERWSEYSDRVFGLLAIEKWEWCFSDFWKRSDNTPQGAAKRILYLLDNGLPDNSYDQMKDAENICY